MLTSAIISSNATKYIYSFIKNTPDLGIENKKKLTLLLYGTDDIDIVQKKKQDIYKLPLKNLEKSIDMNIIEDKNSKDKTKCKIFGL